MEANLYEAMFVVDAAKSGAGFPEMIRHIADLLTRNGAEIQRMEKWDERKLAYPIKRVKRGLYVLVYFTADGSTIGDMRRAIGLSEEVLRVLILRAEQESPVKGQLFSPEGEPVEPPQQAPPAAEPEEPQTSDEPAEEASEPAEEAPAEEPAPEHAEEEEAEEAKEEL